MTTVLLEFQRLSAEEQFFILYPLFYSVLPEQVRYGILFLPVITFLIYALQSDESDEDESDEDKS